MKSRVYLSPVLKTFLIDVDEELLKSSSGGTTEGLGMDGVLGGGTEGLGQNGGFENWDVNGFNW